MVFVKPNNVDIFNAIRKNATIDYQRRVPKATQADVQDVIHNLLNYRPNLNEFIEALVNRIGMEIVKDVLWNNPLSKFKRGMLEWGDTIEEVNIGLVKANRYDPDRQYLEMEIFGRETPDVQSSFHQVNRQDFYKLSVAEPLLKRAFLSDYGLSNFVSKLMATPTTSDNWDEFLLMTSLFKEYYEAGGFFKVNVPDVAAITSDADDAKSLLRAVRQMGDTLMFPSTHYNASGMPVAAAKEDLELFTTPEAKAAMDVNALAAAFNVSYAEVDSRITVIPKENFGIEGAQAILSTREFFVVADQRLDTTSQPNPVGLHTNYFLHHWQVISASRFVPAILFTTEESTVIHIDDTPVTGVTVTGYTDGNGNAVTELKRGDKYQIVATADTEGVNNAVRYELDGAYSPRTYITQTGVLYVSVDEEATSIVVNVYAVDTPIPQLMATFTENVVGDIAEIWPTPKVIPDEDNDGLNEVIPEEPEFTETGVNTGSIKIPSVKGVQYKNGATNVNNGTVIDITAETTITAVARTGYEIATGATTSWTFLEGVA